MEDMILIRCNCTIHNGRAAYVTPKMAAIEGATHNLVTAAHHPIISKYAKWAIAI